MLNETISIGFIGAGRVGFTLGRYFYEKNLKLSGYFSKTYENAVTAGEFTKSNSYKTIGELVNKSDIIFITVPDSVIYDVYLSLKEYDLKGKILCHTSGALSAGVFKDIHNHGAYGYSIHPSFAISDKMHSYEQLSDAFFTIEGDEKKLDIIKELLKIMGNSYKVINADDKYKYHASLVMASNLVIGLYHTSLKTLKECGFSDLEAKKVMDPLLFNNAKSICGLGCVNALTGPVDRNDITTVKEHLSVLEGTSLEVYNLLSNELIEIAKQKYQDRSYENLKNLLNEEKI